VIFLPEAVSGQPISFVSADEFNNEYQSLVILQQQPDMFVQE